MKTISHSNNTSLQANSRSIIFDIECNGLTPDTIWVIVAKEYNGKSFVFSSASNNIEEGIKLLAEADTLIGHNIISFDIPIIKKLIE